MSPERTRDPWTVVADHFRRPYDALTTFLLILPALLFYQVGVMFLPIRNGADLLTDWQVRLWNQEPTAYVMLSAAILAVLFWVMLREREKGRFRAFAFVPLLIESAVYASVTGTAIVAMMRQVHLLAQGPGIEQAGTLARLVLSVGAGVHEEIVFRLLLVGGGTFLLRRLLVFGPLSAFVLCVGGSSLLFAYFHYIGPLSDRFDVGSFVFRFLAGVIFAVLYRLRGLAVAIYTHALYDVIVLL